MIIGIGTDIVHTSRINASLERLGERFAKRILTAHELQQWRQHARPDNFLAKRFAIKEAAAKALGTGLGQGVSWQHISLDHNALGAPQLQMTDAALERAQQLGVNRSLVTLSDEVDTVVAFVVLEQ